MLRAHNYRGLRSTRSGFCLPFLAMFKRLWPRPPGIQDYHGPRQISKLELTAGSVQFSHFNYMATTTVCCSWSALAHRPLFPGTASAAVISSLA
ncbi:hypothetical protein N658DRAFT_26597 [Parathielavia hyrcaniae]|uniref:Uncharacterized protein n=1 Tax=Parathielavia hyrcaniae TaxID=113614 RepID=A0AAN6QDA2_9PEZI|nr:hypothetical protein N658DRAFT_26597 [Parathielavia hyrcaniae]